MGLLDHNVLIGAAARSGDLSGVPQRLWTPSDIVVLLGHHRWRGSGQLHGVYRISLPNEPWVRHRQARLVRY